MNFNKKSKAVRLFILLLSVFMVFVNTGGVAAHMNIADPLTLDDHKHDKADEIHGYDESENEHTAEEVVDSRDDIAPDFDDAIIGGILPGECGVLFEDERYTVEFELDTHDEMRSADIRPHNIIPTGTLGITLGATTLVSGSAANLPVTVNGDTSGLGELSAYILVEGQKLGETPVSNGKATLRLTEQEMDVAAGFYNVYLEGLDGILATASIEVVDLPEGIWDPAISKTEDGLLQMVFVEDVSTIGSLSGKLTINGVNYSGRFREDKRAIVFDCQYDSLREGDKIVAAKIKYPRLYPSYSFTFAMVFVEPQPEQEILLEVTVASGEEYSVAISASDIASFSGTVYTLSYDPAKLELLDFAAQTDAGSISAGPVAGTPVTIVSSSSGVITFSVNKDIQQGKTWSGIITVLRFVGLEDGNAVISIGGNP